MTITPTILSRAAGVAAAVAGLIFIGIQINHPHLDVSSITTTELAVRNSLKVLMAVLALVGITGMYLRQVKQTGLLGLMGYLLLGTGYLVIMGTAFVAATVLPSIAETTPATSTTSSPRPPAAPPPVTSACCRTSRSRHHLPGRWPRLRHRPVPGTCSGPLGGRAPRRRWRRHRRALRDAGRLLPAAGLPERHRHDRPRLLAVEHDPHGHHDATRRCPQPTRQDSGAE